MPKGASEELWDEGFPSLIQITSGQKTSYRQEKKTGLLPRGVSDQEINKERAKSKTEFFFVHERTDRPNELTSQSTVSRHAADFVAATANSLTKWVMAEHNPLDHILAQNDMIPYKGSLISQDSAVSPSTPFLDLTHKLNFFFQVKISDTNQSMCFS